MRGLASSWVLLALTAASVEPILVKFGYRGTVTPLQLLAMKTLVAAVVILPLTRAFRPLPPRDLARIGSVSVLLLVTNGLTLFALRHLTAVTVITVVTVTPAVVALVNQARGRDHLGGRFWAGFWLCFLGVLLTVDAFRPGSFATAPVGLAAVFGAVVSSTVYRVRMEDLTRDHDPRLLSTYIFWINAAAVLLLVVPFLEPVPASALPLGLWIGVAAAVANVAFLWAIKLVGSTNMSMFNLLQRPMVLVAAALLLQEPLTLPQVLGVVLVLVGIPMARAQRR